MLLVLSAVTDVSTVLLLSSSAAGVWSLVWLLVWSLVWSSCASVALSSCVVLSLSSAELSLSCVVSSSASFVAFASSACIVACIARTSSISLVCSACSRLRSRSSITSYASGKAFSVCSS